MDPAFHGIFGYNDWLHWAYLLEGWPNRQCCPLIGWKILATLDRTPSGDCGEARWQLPGYRQDIGWQFGHLRMKSADVRTVSRRRSSGDHWVSLWLCSRSRKSGGDQRISKNSNSAKIRPKSSGHHSIYVVLWPRLKMKTVGIHQKFYIFEISVVYNSPIGIISQAVYDKWAELLYALHNSTNGIKLLSCISIVYSRT